MLRVYNACSFYLDLIIMRVLFSYCVFRLWAVSCARGPGETRSTALVQKDLFIYGFEIIYGYPLSKLL